ncbi:MFS transporter [Patescibacteria group bacterium]|nr:MFS transporter [Patescibacteria group bacterium]
MRNNFIEVLKTKNFIKIWGSQILSQLTVNLLNFILIIKIFESTHSTVAISLFWLFWALPAIFLGPFSGTLIDFLGTRKILIFSNLFQALVVLLYLLIRISVWPIYSILLLYSFLNQFYLPAEAATLPGAVAKRLLPPANSLFLFTTYASLVLGYGLAGPLVKLIGRQFPFAFGSLMLVLAALVVRTLPSQTFSKINHKMRSHRLHDFFKKLNEGYQFIRNNHTVLFPLLILVFSQIILSILAVLAPALVVKILDTDLINISSRLILPIGIGGVLGLITTVRLLKNIRKRYLINVGFFLLSFSLFFLVLAVPHFHAYLKIMGEILFGLVAGFAFSLFTVPTQTLLQEKTPNNLRGRVFGVLGFLITISSVLPVLLVATIGEFLGEIWMILILALAIFSLGLFSLKGENVIYRFYRS